MLLAIAGYLLAEGVLHDRRLKKIRIRIHVNGTRGKSSVTRLIAASLRRSGIRTLAKTTGSTPELILPDGSCRVLRRWGPANVLEQIGVVRRAAQLQVDALVVECMALNPQLQWVCEHQLIHSTIGVITNVRPDHFEVMGDSLDDIAQALSQSVPVDSVLVTGDAHYFPFFQTVAARLGTQCSLADVQSQGQLSGGHLIFEDNVAIAQKVCALLGIDAEVVNACVADALLSATSTVSTSRIVDGKTVHFVDAFSANDIDSTQRIERWVSANAHCPKPWVALFCNRADRPLRMRSFARFLGESQAYEQIALIGESLSLAGRHFRHASPTCTVLTVGGRAPDRVVAELLRQLPYPEFTLIGMGNEKGLGRNIARLFCEA